MGSIDSETVQKPVLRHASYNLKTQIFHVEFDVNSLRDQKLHEKPLYHRHARQSIFSSRHL
ncbi:hypothetical protein Patl1_33961 [Pistacia atlantica]|uniref:Uncharacterized protein n=1 Tax=Pistacia atlantica TaxID=434234 RepID=A0ACC0ZUG4_9ROSI|nr:hypothetical protein Patl1_33961 [Pistacia atlantica]